MIQHNTPIPVENLTLMQLLAYLRVAHEELRGRLEVNEARAADIDQRLATAQQRLREAVRADRARVQIGRISRFGLMYQQSTITYRYPCRLSIGIISRIPQARVKSRAPSASIRDAGGSVASLSTGGQTA